MNLAVQERLSNEILRKLSLAVDTDDKDDRDIICAEVFADVTGDLNRAARESTGTIYRRWYEVLAPYFCKTPTVSEELLAICRRLWGQPFIAPIFALLLHQWLLIHPESGGADQRLKLLNVLMSGARQLFIGDIESGGIAFAPLHSFITEAIVVTPERLDALPSPGKEGVVGVAAAFLPYYEPTHKEFIRCLRAFPDLDTAIDKMIATSSREIRAEGATLRYISALAALRDSPNLLGSLRTSTRIHLQGELYSLTQPGGPRYASRAVNRLAFRTLDTLFPHGRRTRRLINLWFRFLHPQEWPWVWWDTITGAIRTAIRWIKSVVRKIAAPFRRHRRCHRLH